VKKTALVLAIAAALVLGGSVGTANAVPTGSPSLTATSVTCSSGQYTVTWQATAYPYNFTFGFPSALSPAGSVTTVGSSLPSGQANPFRQTRIAGTSTSASIIDLPLNYSTGHYTVSGTVVLPGTCGVVSYTRAWVLKHRAH
jgi:hypothetical protein